MCSLWIRRETSKLPGTTRTKRRKFAIAAAPVTALGVSATGPTALKVTGDTARLVAVTTGIRDGAWVEISQGLTAGQTVVTKAGAFVRDGDHIAPIAASN